MSGELILIVEDNEKNRKLARDVLQYHGYRTIEAETAEDGIRLAQESVPALILMDIQLPVLDGYEATRRIREDPELASVPVIAVTSYAMVGDRERALQAGCTAYVEKPIQPEQFIAEIKKYL